MILFYPLARHQQITFWDICFFRATKTIGAVIQANSIMKTLSSYRQKLEAVVKSKL